MLLRATTLALILAPILALAAQAGPAPQVRPAARPVAEAAPVLRPLRRPAPAVAGPDLRPQRRPGAEAGAHAEVRSLAAEVLVALVRAAPAAAGDVATDAATDAARAEAAGIAAAAVAALSPAADPAPPAILAAVPPRDRLDPAAHRAEGVVTSTAGTLAPAAAGLTFRPVAALAIGPRARPGGAAAVLPVAAVLPPLRPMRRPGAAAPDPAPAAAALIARRPLARPAGLALPVPAAAAPRLAPAVLALSLPRPLPRPKGLARKAERAARSAEARAAEETVTLAAAAPRVDPGAALVKPKKGSACGDRAIRGETLAPIPGKVAGCGIAAPVRVTEVAGVRLSPAATLDCSAAVALKTWVERALKPAAGRRDVVEIKVAASYSCRPRNNIRGNKISEHGKGRAIDISAVVLGDGRVLDVLTDYKSDSARVLRSAHKAACGIFGTTLGPGSDGFHENHLHFDTAAYRSGPYCR